MKNRIIAVLPAYNEEGRVGKAVLALKSSDKISKIFVVNDGSSDRTGEEAKKAGAYVFEIKKNLGKGRALREFFLSALAEETLKEDDVILLIDADTAQTSVAAAKLAAKLVEIGKGHFVVAVLPSPLKKGGFGLVKNLARRIIEATTGVRLKAPLSGQRALFWDDLKKVLRAFNYGYGLEVAMNYLLLKNGLLPVEVQVEMRHRETGRNLKDFYHRGRQFADVIRVVKDVYLGKL
jgi:glycosyltransferase involved in cell wall biosynthesis